MSTSRAATGYSGRAGSSSPGWEVRLGRLQVTVWLGLAIGACVGGYFVGFFSGRYVGFESARESSSGEVPKLPAPDLFADASALNPNGVYDRLKAPAILPDSGGPRASAKVAEVVDSMGGAQHAQLAEPTDVKRAAPAAQPQAPETVGRGANTDSGNQAPGDEIFDDLAPNERLIIGDDGAQDAQRDNKVPPSVRLLGGASKDSQSDGTQGVGEARRNDSSSSAAAILDARIANARSETSRQGPASQPDAPEAKKASNASQEPQGESSGLVRKVLPPGYFAQVSAPKKLAEAEAVAKKLKRSGFPVVVESASVNGQSFYRVLVGPEENKLQAERLVSQLQSESFVASKPFIRKVK